MDVTARVNLDEATSAAVRVETKPVETAVAEKFTERAKISYEYDVMGKITSLENRGE